MTIASIFLGALLTMTTPSSSQTVPFDSAHWQWEAGKGRVEEYLGRQSLFLKGGIATATGTHFTNGEIEFDVAFTRDRGFMGGLWRLQDAGNFEEFYLRPHQSGNPDANQYEPVFHGLEAWQLYHGERYSVPVVYRFDEWTHVRIRFAGAQAEVYIQDMEKPVLFIDELKRDVEPGAVGVSVTNGFAPAHFSNFSFQATDSLPLKGRPRAPEPVPPGVVPFWWVSDTFPESALGDGEPPGWDLVAERTWTRLQTERSGLANLARLQGLRPPKNTVFVRRTLHSDREQIRRLDFGFSDRVKVYLNGRLLFRGDDTARSRDYRFLGSIGFYDALYLPLKEGENELLLAVSEESGGWGVQAKLPDSTGLAFHE
jgi:hypothetical protein